MNAQLEVSESDRTAFTFVDEGGQTLNMERFLSGGGLLGYTVEGVYVDMLNDLVESSSSIIYPESMQVTANNVFYYDIDCNDDGSVKLDTNAVLEKAGVAFGETCDITIYAFSDRGYLYVGVIEATILADEVIVTPSTEASSIKVESTVYDSLVKATVTANDVAGDQVTMGLLIPETADLSLATITVDGAAVTGLETYTNADGAVYLEVPVSADTSAATILVDWAGDGNVRTYEISLAGVTQVEDIITVEGNVVEIDLVNGRANGELEITADGALALAEGETYAEYYSPVYDSFDWEYGMTSINAYLPGTSSVDMQLRAYTQRAGTWSDWFSMGKLGVGAASASVSKQGDDVNVDPDVFTLRGSSSVANALRWQVRLVFRGNESGEQPAVYHADVTYKKSAYDPDEAGEIDTSVLPASAGVEAEGYSAYDYAPGMSAWRFETLELIALNAMGSDLLFEEVALGGYDQSTGWGNWNMTNYKPGIFGHRAYTQFGASAALIQQAIADGNVVGLYVRGNLVPGTNTSSTSQTVVYSYYTAEDGTVMFKLICPRGDGSEVDSGAVYGEISAAGLDAAIVNYGSSSVRGLMYVIGAKEYESSWQRIEAEAVMVDSSNEAFTVSVDGEQLKLATDFLNDKTNFGKGGVIAYTLFSETDPNAKLAAGEFYYSGISIKADGSITVPSALKAEMEAYGTAQIYIIRNDGITYVATLEHGHAWDEGVVTKEPTTSSKGVKTYTCDCGATYTEDIAKLPLTPVGPSLSDKQEGEDVVEPVELPFVDVNEGQWFYDEVAYVYENELMNGMTETAFAPYAELTRGMVVTILWRMDGEPVSQEPCQFADVAAGSYYEQAIAWAAEEGIVTGYDAVTFGPDDMITREQMAAVLYRYAQYKEYDVSVGEDTNILSYVDAFEISEYAYPAMQWACGAGLINGIDDALQPQGYATRAQAAALLQRFCENVK